MPSAQARGFNFDTLTFIGMQAGETTSVKALENGWYRIAITIAQPASPSNLLVDIGLAYSATSPTSSWTPAGTEQVYFWGLQWERGPLTDYEEASGYIAIGNKSTRYQPFDDGVATTLGGLGTSSNTPRILGGGGGGGSGGSVTGHGSQEESGEGGGCTTGSSHSGGSGGAGAGPSAATAGSSGSSPAGAGGSGGTYGAAGSSGGGGAGSATDGACAGQVSNGAGGAGGAAGKAIHLISGATLTLRDNGSILGATS